MCVGGVILLSRFCHKQTEGFRLTKIEQNLKEGTETTLSQEQKQFVSELLRQKFSFLGRGKQSFVFASEDGQYVLKVFNNRYQRKIGLLSLLTPFPWIGTWAKSQTNYCQKKLAGTFESYEIALEEMPEQTGLVFLHLSPTEELSSPLLLVDKLQITHSLDPNQVGFLIQKRARLIYPTLKECLQQGDKAAAERLLSSLIDLFLWKWEHGILDNDPLIRTNYGLAEGKVIQIDVGPLSKGTLSPEEQKKELFRITASLRSYLSEQAPDLLPCLDQKLGLLSRE